MKTRSFVAIFILLMSFWGHGQIQHRHYNNNDRKTRAKLSELIAYLAVRETNLSQTNGMLEAAINNRQEQFRKDYAKNGFDKENAFFSSSIGSASIGFATSALGTYVSLPYMPRARKEFLQQLALDKSILIAVQNVDATKIRASDRQQIYQLRAELIRQFSKNDKEAREILMFSAGAMGILGVAKYAAFREMLESIEISL